MATNGSPRPGRRTAIIAGLRTPFLKAGTEFRDLSAVELGAQLVNELVARSGLDPKIFDAVIFGQVVPSQLVTLIGREVVLRSQLPKTVQAWTVSRACATSIQATTDAADQIALGHADTVIAGGAESLSDAPIFASRKLAQALVTASRAKGLGQAKVIVKHVMRNAMIPVVTLIALQMPAVFGGAIVTEQIFRVPGIGSLLVASLEASDTPVIMGVTFIYGVLVVIFNLLADIVYGFLDPRIKYS